MRFGRLFLTRRRMLTLLALNRWAYSTDSRWTAGTDERWPGA